MNTPRRAGWLDSFRSLGAGLLSTVHERVELFAVELHEEKCRLVQTFLCVNAAVLAGMMTLTFASLTLLYFFPAGARLLVLAGLTVLYAGALLATVMLLRRLLARQTRPFAATLAALDEDRACIRDEN
jgi:uncharacterized membrane protein YqjE